MLRQLKISNLAILPELTVTFSHGLNVLTGETGAGKSILIDAIGLLAGRRASSDDVRTGTDLATVEGVFEFSDQSPVWKVLAEAGIDVSSREFIIRRTISADGRSRAVVNDAQWTVSGLVRLAAHWIDISGQHGQQELMIEENHLEYLDTFGGLGEESERYRATFHDVRRLDSEVEALRGERAEAQRQQDFLTFQAKELNEAQLRRGEEEELKTVHRRVANAERLLRSAEEAEGLLDGDTGISSQLGRLLSEIRSAAQADESVEEWAGEIEAMAGQISDLAYRVSRYRRALDVNPAEIGSVESRLARLHEISRKYGSIDKAIDERDRIAGLLSRSEDFDDNEGELLAQRKLRGRELFAAAKKLTAERMKTAKAFEAKVTKELRRLGMPNAKFAVRFSAPSSDNGRLMVGKETLGPSGAEEVGFDFAPNPGEGFRPIARIASGGELSRILLAIKGIGLSAQKTSDRTYLFDEVDTGIGGQTGERVGVRLRVLARGRQVLCVTHLAQIACYASAHLWIDKKVRGGRTLAEIIELDAEGRRDELARMIGGIQVTPKTIDHAAELLQRGGAKSLPL